MYFIIKSLQEFFSSLVLINDQANQIVESTKSDFHKRYEKYRPGWIAVVNLLVINFILGVYSNIFVSVLMVLSQLTSILLIYYYAYEFGHIIVQFRRSSIARIPGAGSLPTLLAGAKSFKILGLVCSGCMGLLGNANIYVNQTTGFNPMENGVDLLRGRSSWEDVSREARAAHEGIYTRDMRTHRMIDIQAASGNTENVAILRKQLIIKDN